MFTGINGALSISNQSLNASQAFLPKIAGFGASDIIDYQGTVTSVSYAGTTLTLFNGSTTVATLTLQGNYAGSTFYANANDNGTQISVSTGGDTNTAPPGTTAADQYVFGPNVAGSWDNPSNWIDTTTGQNPAAVAPGVNDLVTIAAAAGDTDVVTGIGDAASLSVAGNVDLKGHFTTAALSFAAYGAAVVDVAAGLSVTGDFNAGFQSQLTIAGGAFSVTGSVIEDNSRETLTGGTATVGAIKTSAGQYSGSSYTVTGGTYDDTGSYASSNDYVSVSGSGQFDVNGNTALGNDGFTTSDTGSIVLASVTTAASESDAFYIYGSSTIEIGSTGGIAAGSFTLDAGQTLTDGGSIQAPHIVINGTLAVGDGETLQLTGGIYDQATQKYDLGGLTGSGTITIGNNAELDINYAVDSTSTNTIQFLAGDTGGVLSIDPSTLTSNGAFLPKIAGFGASDIIDYQGTVTSVSYAGTTLTLFNGSTTVATLTLQGNYASSTFIANANGNGNGTQISISTGGDTNTAPPGTTAADQYAWNAIEGSWDNPSNWIDTTTGQSPAAVAPGVNDLVTIAAAAGDTDVVTGIGDAASLSVAGNVDLKGHFTTAALSFAAYGAAVVDVAAGLSVTGDFNAGFQSQLTIAGGAFSVTGSVIEDNSRETLTGGTATVGAIKTSAGQYSGSSYTVTGGTYDDTGSYASSNDYVSVSGSGQFDVNGNTALGNDGFTTSDTGSIVLASVTTAASESDAFYIYGSSTIEIGSTGGIAAGSFTLDAGQTLTDGGSIQAPHIVINGTLAVGDGETLQLTGGIYDQATQKYDLGGLTGSGTITIGNNAELDINYAVDSTSTNTIQFLAGDTGGVLSIDPSTLTSNGAFLPKIAGFGASDIIDYQGTVTSVSYAGTTLTLFNGSTTVATLTLQGNYAGSTFYANANDNGTQISVSTGGDTNTAPPGTTAADQYVFGPNVAGSWDNPSNWIDTTTGQSPAAVAPGVNDLVTIAAAAGDTDVVTGIGDAASLSVAGNVDLKGHFTTAALSFAAYGAAVVDVAAGLSVTGDFNAGFQSQLTIAGGAFSVTGSVIEDNSRETLTGGTATVGAIKTSAGQYSGSSYTVTGGTYDDTGSYASSNDYVSVSGSGQFDVNGNTALGNDGFTTSDTGSIVLASVTTAASESDAFYIYGSSTIEIGSTGGIAAGSFTLDAGQTLTDGGSIQAPHIVINGTLAVGDGETLQLTGGIYDQATQKYDLGGLTGSGTITIGNNAELDINYAVDSTSTNTIQFLAGDTGGVLSIDPSTLTSNGAFLPKIAGFGASDIIDYQGTVTSVSYAGTTLTLFNGSTTVATLTLQGNYAGSTFYANAHANGYGTQISVSTGGDTNTAPPGTTAADQYVFGPNVAGSWDNPSNWIDTTTGQSPAAVAPGGNDLVTIAAAQGTIDVVTGIGNAASLSVAGNVDLKGHFTTAALSFAAYGAAVVDVAAGLSVTGDFNAGIQSQLTIAGGAFSVTGSVIEDNSRETLTGGTATVGAIKTSAGQYSGSSYTVTGGTYDDTGSYASSNDYVSVSGSGQFDVNGNTALGNDGFTTSDTGSIVLASVTTAASESDAFYIYGSSTIEIGSTGGIAAGSFTLDAGQTLTDGGSIQAPHIVINGTLAVGDGETLQLTGGIYDQATQKYDLGGLTGSGTITIGNNAELDINYAVDSTSTNTIQFLAGDTGGVLSIDPSTLTSNGAFLPKIAGFGARDVIDYGAGLTNVVFGNGGLTLLQGNTIIGSLALTGSYAGQVFNILSSSSNQSQIEVESYGANAPPNLSFSSVSYVDTGVKGDGITNNPRVTFSGTVSDAAGISNVEVYDNGQDLGSATLSGTKWTFATTFVSGSYGHFSAIAFDSNGFGSEALNSTTFTVDTQPPSQPSTPTISVASGNATINGTAELGSTVDLYDGTNLLGSASVASNGTYTLTEAFSGASNLLSVISVDVAGNSSKASSGLDIAAGSFVLDGPGHKIITPVSISQAASVEVTGTGYSLASAMTGLGTLTFANGSTTLGAGASISTAYLDMVGSGTNVTFGTNLTYAGTLSVSGGATLTFTTGALTLTGASSFAGAYVSGAHTLSTNGSTSISGLTLGGTAAYHDLGSTTQAGGNMTVGDQSTSAASLYIASLGTYAIADDSGIARGNSTLSNIQNLGTFEKTGGTGISAVAVSIKDSGKITVNSGTLAFMGPINSFSGSLTGTGVLDLGGGTNTLYSNISLGISQLHIDGKGTIVNLSKTLTYGGSLIQGSGSVFAIASANTFTITGTAAISGQIGGAGTLAIAGGGTSLNAGAALSVSRLSIGGNNTNLYINTHLTYAGVFGSSKGSAISVSAGDILSLGGASNVAGAVSGAGTLAFYAGNATLKAGATLSIANLSVAGTLTSLTIDAALSYGGSFTEGTGSLVALDAGSSLTLSGSGSFLRDTIDGAGRLTTNGASSVGLVTLGGTASWYNAGTLTEAGTLTVGDAAGNAATFLNQANGVFDVASAAGIAVGNSTTSKFTNQGLLEKTAGAASVVSIGIVNTGTIAAASGTLDFQGTVAGSGKATITNKAILEFDGSVALGTAVSFGTGGGTLLLKAAPSFAGTIGGLSSGDTIDVGSFVATGYTYAVNSQKSGGTLKLTNGSTTESLKLVGTYTSTGFHVTKGKSGDTLVTYATPSSAARPMAVEPQPVVQPVGSHDAHMNALTAALFDGAFAPSMTTELFEINMDHHYLQAAVVASAGVEHR